MKQKNSVLTETLWLGLGVLICLGLMLSVYALIGHFSMSVLLGGLVGSLLTVGNFFFMAVGLTNMTSGDKEGKIRVRVQGSFALRMVLVFALLVAAIKLLKCDTLATVIPLLCMRPILTVRQFLFQSHSAEIPVNSAKEEQDES